MSGWYKIVAAGQPYVPAAGPFRTREEAVAAWKRFEDRHGWRAGTWIAASNACIAGPFRTRAIARSADISDWSDLIDRTGGAE